VQKTAEYIEMPFGTDSRGSKEPRTRWMGAWSSTGRGTFEGACAGPR